MHSFGFYPKLAFGNLWRNRSTYLPYLLACIVSVFTFYTMMAINGNGALDGMRGESVVKSFTAIGTIILAIFCSVLIFYTNSFLIKRRKKELGLYSVLGMEKKNIAVLMFYETLFVAGIALVLGLGLGLLLSQLLFWVLLRMVRFTVMLEMPVSGLALGITAALFGLVFLLALLSNLRQVRLANPVELMAGAKQGEKEPKTHWLLAVVGVLCLGAGYFIALYYQNPVEVLMMFLVAVFLVIIGTYCLFTAGSVAVLKLLRKNKNYYYQPGHFISVSGMIYRMKQNAAGLAAICILSCMVLVTVSATVALNVGAEDSLEMQYPYEYEFGFKAPEDTGLLLAGAEEMAQKDGVALVNQQDYTTTSFIAQETNGQFAVSQNDDAMLGMIYFSLMTLEDYNRNEGTHVALEEGQALLLVTGGHYDKDTLVLNGRTYDTQPLECFGKAVSGGRDVTRSFLLVLPNQAAIDEVVAAGESEPYTVGYTLAFDLEGSEEAKQQFGQDYNNYINNLSTSDHFNYRDREGARESWYASNGGFLFLGIYFGVLFMLAAALIIYYKQISEGYDDAGRFEILQKVGMGEDEVKKTINGQVLTVFFLPLLVAVIHVAVAFFPISRAMVIFGVMNIPLLIFTSVLTALAYAVLYLLVFRQTARTYFRIVRRQASSS